MAKIRTKKYIINPEYAAERAEQTKDMIAVRGGFVEDYFPEEYDKKLPDTGSWILITIPITVGKEKNDGGILTIEVPRFSIWYALPASINRYKELTPQKAEIQTPNGSVCIFPHEYRIVDIASYLVFTEKEGFYINYMTESAKINETWLFYLQSRGIGRAEATRMLLPEIKDPYYCYFTFHEEYHKYFEGVGMPLKVRDRMLTPQ